MKPSRSDTALPSTLVETKLYVPRPKPGVVSRPRLTERLNQGAAAKLQLVSAPAGFGKTTLVADWLARWLVEPPQPLGQPGSAHTAHTAQPARSAAWLSLDEGDSLQATFWAYVIAALQKVAPEVGSTATQLLASVPPVPIETVLTHLVNGLAARPGDVVLVLDDYHLVDAHDVQLGMVFLIEHLPPHVHLLICSRADPALPLARLRARGELIETRASDLRFTPTEAATYLNGVMDLALSDDDMVALEARTEGWIAALQLAALSMRGRDDLSGFINGFTGDDRYVVDYLLEEVLHRQPEHVQAFLLQTSILARLTGPLCDAVTGQSGGKEMLDSLDRGNLFLVPLDDRRRWYRYHHLFGDVLQARLLDQQPDMVGDLHRRASIWYADNGELTPAVAHALAHQDFERAADLVERAWPHMRRTRQEATLLDWLKSLPGEVVMHRPVLSAAYAGVLLSNGMAEGVESHLVHAQHGLETAEPMIVVDADEFRRLPAAIAMYSAALALMRGDLDGASDHASQAHSLASEEDHPERGAAAGLLGLAHWTRGDLDGGYRLYAECKESLRRAGFLADTFGCALALADIRLVQGRLRSAMRIYRDAVIPFPDQGALVLRGTADMYVGMSQVQLERNELEAAAESLRIARELGEHLGLRQNPYRWCVAMAGVRQAEGNLDDALDLLLEAERRYVGDMFPNVRPVPAMTARLRVLRGELPPAISWAQERAVCVDDELTYLREYEHITLARILLARHDSERLSEHLNDAHALLNRLLHAADQGGRDGSVIEILLLLARAEGFRGDVVSATAASDRAVALAEPEGYVRLFLDTAPQSPTQPDPTKGSGTRIPSVPRLIEPLSERELHVLRLLRTELGGPEIAGQLVVSLHTVRSHTKKIYAKLGVNNRRAAVLRAEELELFS